MKITRELNLQNFEFWAGATSHYFTYSELEELQHPIEDFYPDGATETEINDLFWFEEQLLCELIGVDYNEYLER